MQNNSLQGFFHKSPENLDKFSSKYNHVDLEKTFILNIFSGILILWSFASGNLFNNGQMLHSPTLHTSDMKHKYMKSTEVVMPSLLAFGLLKVKVTIKSFLFHFSRSVYFMTYLSTSK